MKCKKHPRYTGQQRPRTDCEICRNIYFERHCGDCFKPLDEKRLCHNKLCTGRAGQ